MWEWEVGGVRLWCVVLLADAIAPLTSPAFGGATMISSSRRSLTPKATIALQVIGSAILAENERARPRELGRGRKVWVARALRSPLRHAQHIRLRGKAEFQSW